MLSKFDLSPRSMYEDLPFYGGDRYGEGEKDIELMGQSIVARRVDPETRGIRTLILEDGTEVDVETAMKAVEEGDSKGLIVQNGPFGKILKTSPDGSPNNNLRDLPVADDNGVY